MRGSDDLAWLEEHRQRRQRFSHGRTERWWSSVLVDIAAGMLVAFALVIAVVLFLSWTVGGGH